MYEIQIETISRYSFTPNKLAKIKNFDKTHYGQEYGETDSFIHCWCSLEQFINMCPFSKSTLLPQSLNSNLSSKNLWIGSPKKYIQKEP